MRWIFNLLPSLARGPARAVVYAAGLGAALSSARAELFRAQNFNGRVWADSVAGTQNIGRGQRLNPPATFRLGRGATLFIEGGAGSAITLVGPAQLDYLAQGMATRWELRYGDAELRCGAREALELQTPAGPANCEADGNSRDARFGLRVPPSGLLTRIVNLGAQTIRVGALTLDANEVAQISRVSGREELWRSVASPDELARQKQFFANARLAQSSGAADTASNLDAGGALPTPTREPLPWMIRLGALAGVSRFSPEGTTQGGQSGNFGFLRVSRRKAWGIADGDPRVKTLRAKTLELGVELDAGAPYFSLSPLVRGNARSLLVLVPVGWSYQQLQITLLPGAGAYDLGHDLFLPQAARLTLGAEIEYRADLGRWTDSELGVSLALRYLWSSVAASAEGNGASIRPTALSLHFLALGAAVSYRF